MKVLQYIKARFAERSTWMAVGAGVTGGAALNAPWSYAFVAVALAGAMTPTGGQA